MRDTIELTKVIEIILKGKWIILISTIIFVLFSGTLSWFVLPEKYESEAVLQVASSVQDTGIMDSFVATEFTPEIYVQRANNNTVISKAFQEKNLSNEYNENNLNITFDSNSKFVTLSYTSDSPENSQKELQTILDAVKNEMNASLQFTLKNLENTYSKDAESLSKEIEEIINEYNNIIRVNKLPEILILQTILNSDMVINISEEQTTALSSVSGAVQNQLLQLQAQIQTKSEEYRNVLEKYQSVKTGLENFKADPFIRIIAEPSLPNEASSPKIVLNMIVGFVLGIMVGLIITLIKQCWRKAIN